MDGWMDDLPDLGRGSVDGYILATLTSFSFLFVCNLRRTIFLGDEMELCYYMYVRV